MARDTVGRTIAVAAVLCVVCSVVVSTAAVVLRDRQEENKQLDRNKNILIAAGVIEEKSHPSREEIMRLFDEKVRPVFVDLATGDTVEPVDVGIDPATWDPRGAARDPKYGTRVDPPDALFGVNTRAKYAFVYKVMDGDRVGSYVLPIYGNGLWSTLYGFLALKADAREIQGITFYEHGETPGLGGEVENEVWKAGWNGKAAINDQGNVIIEVIKGQVTPGSPSAGHQVDGLSGATITTRGVSSLVQYWLGPEGFGKYLDQVRSGGTNAPAGEADRG
jgi:Na+-transporting NADH:ubiquinone oxidoreductase subunit C